jgi:hypothetical protein
MTNFNDTLVGSLRSRITELENSLVRMEQDTIRKTGLLRDLLIGCIRDEEDASAVINSVADLFDVELTRDITVSIPLTVTATLTVPADFDIADLDITDVSCDAWNTEVDNFNVESWDVDWISEV